ncbi:sensor histidine kinase [Dyadobacter psychrophilus]|uniref:Histidine kinase n=1 Tax=Dyadobacter psychrophilus TaxID=651661 RepID=A0A1T5HF91_9BACT|nr:sensor histidine kinase [Dyadobacter psychrophilus]SKC19355.1 Histidine kinase [Dyadobacter psychrophilus]
MFQAKNLWIVHIAGWLIFISLPITIMSRDSNPDVGFALLKSGHFWVFAAIYVFLFYFNYLWLIPKLYLKQRHLLYIVSSFGLIVLIHYTQPFENLIFQQFHSQQEMGQRNRFDRPPPQPMSPHREGTEFRPPPPRNAGAPSVDFVSLVLFIMIWVIAMAAKISEQWRLTEKRAILSEADKAQAELSFFKAQINPHFLFNTLNNIYALAVNQSENTAPSVLKLSKMMRYITEEATENFVALEDEIDCLENYIDLQKLRLNAKTSVLFEVNELHAQTQIAPLILMTFVENAFKYGVSNHYASKIEIKINTAADEIRFFCRNKVFDSNKDPDRAGVGIVNTKKRLDFLYAGNYNLKIDNDGEIFSVNLKLKSNEMHSH